MDQYRKSVTFLFIFTLFICQSGVCMAAVSQADDEPSAGSTESTHSCHDMKSNPEISDNAQTDFSLEGTGLVSSDCCFTGTINTRDIVPEIIQFPVLLTLTALEPDTYSSYHTNGQYNNRGHPPGAPVFILNTVLII